MNVSSQQNPKDKDAKESPNAAEQDSTLPIPEDDDFDFLTLLDSQD
jgi:hypothetical protein